MRHNFITIVRNIELCRPYWAYERWFLNMVALTHYPVIYRPFRTFTSQENLSSYREIIVTRAFFRVFQACRIRLISQEMMLIVMLLRLSAAYILFSDLYITISLSLVWALLSNNKLSLNRQAKSRPVTSNR